MIPAKIGTMETALESLKPMGRSSKREERNGCVLSVKVSVKFLIMFYLVHTARFSIRVNLIVVIDISIQITLKTNKNE